MLKLLSRPAINEVPGIDMVKVASYRVTPIFVNDDQIRVADERRRFLEETVKDMLPVEEGSRSQVMGALGVAKIETSKLQMQRKVAVSSRGKYQLLDPVIFGWRDHHHLPIFAVFDLDQSKSQFISTARRFSFRDEPKAAGRCNPVLPGPIYSRYADVFSLLNERSLAAMMNDSRASEITVSISTQFAGLIPAYVKHEVIRARKSGLFKRIVMVAEVVEWLFDKMVVSRKGDPLIVGFDELDQLWLICAFDTTSVEEMVAQEFAVRVDV